MDLRVSLLLLVATPDRAYLTLLAGLLLVYRELARPGRVLPGIVGGVFAVTAMWALAQYRFAWTGVGVVLLAAALAALQARRTWRWIPGAAACLCLFAGSHWMLAPPSQISWKVAAASLPFGGITVFLLRTAVIARRSKRV